MDDLANRCATRVLHCSNNPPFMLEGLHLPDWDFIHDFNKSTSSIKIIITIIIIIFNLVYCHRYF